MKIQKTKEGAFWRVYAGGRKTPLLIGKGLAPRFREPQEWNVFDDDDNHYLTANSLTGCMSTLERLAAILTEKAA